MTDLSRVQKIGGKILRDALRKNPKLRKVFRKCIEEIERQHEEEAARDYWGGSPVSPAATMGAIMGLEAPYDGPIITNIVNDNGSQTT